MLPEQPLHQAAPPHALDLTARQVDQTTTSLPDFRVGGLASIKAASQSPRWDTFVQEQKSVPADTKGDQSTAKTTPIIDSSHNDSTQSSKDFANIFLGDVLYMDTDDYAALNPDIQKPGLC
jgi:hypothetical protein